VRTLSDPLGYIHIPRWNGTQNFAKIAQADAAQFARLPGFGPKKVARLKDAFERPFRTGTTSALAAPSTSVPALAAAAAPSASTKSPLPAPDPTSTERPAQSPLWDIELDLNSPSPSPPPLSELTLARDTTPGAGPSKRAREESPQWDIERGAPLALDDEDSDLGAPGLGLEEDAGADAGVDVDMDIAPALRAKRRRA
jgi:hypothetical protein